MSRRVGSEGSYGIPPSFTFGAVGALGGIRLGGRRRWTVDLDLVAGSAAVSRGDVDLVVWC